VFSFLDKALLDNSIHRTYGSLLSNLTFVKSIASGIMVPKSYIWPVTKDNYLQQAPTSIVAEAHSAGLEIYASDFANDRIIPYNYSYDPLAEYLNFISDGGFSVDGVLSEHPITASGAIGCFANLNSSKTDHGEPLIISHNGASGDYPDCTDLAYHSAINDGADVIDCPVQVTSDGTLMCMSSVNLLDTTNVQRTPFSSRASVVSEIQATPGVFTFNLTWDDINSSIQPKISCPLSRYYMVRNPRYTNQGKFLKLYDFLAMGMDKDLSGVMIIIENAAFLAKSLGIDIVDSVNAALNAAGYDNQTAKGVLIQSKDSAVLVKLKQQKTKCKLVYTLPSGIGDVSTSSLEAVKKFADAVVVDKDNSVFTSSHYFIIRQNNLMKDLQSSGLAVYAQVFRNEFVSQPLDFFSDETVEINYYFQSFNLSGIITDFPKTVRRYKKNTCTGLGNDMPNYMQAVPIGALDQLLQKFKAQPPSMPPMPTLNASDVVETPLPPVAPRNAPGAPLSDTHKATASTGILFVMVFAALLI